MADGNIEIEIRFPLYNPEDVKQFLDTNAESKSQNVHQKDIYYTPSHRDFLKVKYPYEWLRLRESHKGISINYKHFYPENVDRTDFCNEFETKIEDTDTMRKIFQSLDFKEAAIVEKVRSAWLFEDVEIVIDDVQNLGSFIELEATTRFDDPKEAKIFLMRILEKLNAKVGEEDIKGYPFRLLEKNGYRLGE